MSGYSCRGFSIATLRHVKHTTPIKKICRIVEHATTVNRHVALLTVNLQHL